MSETKREYDNFYGSPYFYPGLYTLEEAWRQKQLMKTDLWPLAIDICYAGGLGNYYISRVNPQGHTVLLSNKHGWPLLEVSVTETQYAINNWSQYLKARGRDKYRIHSAKRPYLVKAIRPYLEPISRDAITQMNAQIIAAARKVNEFLNEATNNAANIAVQSLPPTQAYAALRLIFDPDFTKLKVDQNTLSALEITYKALCEKFANKKTYVERLKDMFDHPKWVIGYIPLHGKNFLIIGTVKLTPINIGSTGSYKLEYDKPLQLYNGFEQFYTNHPEEEGSLKTALMFCKVHREKDPTQVQTYDKEGFIPRALSGVYEDIGGISFCNNYSGMTSTQPHFLLLQK